MRRAWVTILLIALGLIVPVQGALITGVTGNVDILTTPPASAVALQSNTVTYVFPERSLQLTSPLPVDVLTSGSGPYSTVTPGMLASGTLINSFYFHENPVNGSVNAPIINYVGSVTFDSKILGLILLDSSLLATDGSIGVPGTTYNQPPLQGLEFGSILDQFTVSGNTLWFNLQSREASDNIRILVDPVPEPSTVLMILPGLGLVALGVLRRRRS